MKKMRKIKRLKELKKMKKIREIKEMKSDEDYFVEILKYNFLSYIPNLILIFSL